MQSAATSVPRSRRLLLFVMVGCAAAAVHWGLVVWLVSRHGVKPLVANVAAWMLALLVSFGGHRLFTFADAAAPMAQSAPRFVLLSAAGFALNELSYAGLLALGVQRYDLALAAVLVLVAGSTFVASRLWVFRPPKMKKS